MARSGGTYTAPSNSFNPAVEGETIDEAAWNETLTDLEAALTESVYTAGLGASANQVVLTDGTDTKKIKSIANGNEGDVLAITGGVPAWGAAGAGDLISTNNLSDVANAATAATNLGLGTGNSPQFTGVNIGHASDTTITRTGAGDIAIEGNAVYRAGGTDVAVADGGTGASTAAAGFRALAEGIGSTQGDILYRGATEWVALSAGTSGYFLASGGPGGNPSWTAATGTGDMIGANNLTDVSNASTARLNLGVSPGIPQGRLTLTTATPILTSTTSAAGTIYYTPHVGQHVPLYDGTRWKMHDIGGELSQAVSDSTKSPAGVTTNSNYDLFVWDDSGTYRCTRGPAWTSDTARGTGAGTTELQYVAGLLVNKIAITNGPAAQRGTYVGTIRTNGSSTVDYIFGAAAAGGTAASFGVWNAYNRVLVSTSVRDTTDSWTLAGSAGGTVRSANNSTTMRVSFVSGLAVNAASAAYTGIGSAGASGQWGCGVGYDSTTAYAGIVAFTALASSQLTLRGAHDVVDLGWHYFQALEMSRINATTQTFYGDLGIPLVVQSGLEWCGWM